MPVGLRAQLWDWVAELGDRVAILFIPVFRSLSYGVNTVVAC